MSKNFRFFIIALFSIIITLKITAAMDGDGENKELQELREQILEQIINTQPQLQRQIREIEADLEDHQRDALEPAETLVAINGTKLTELPVTSNLACEQHGKHLQEPRTRILAVELALQSARSQLREAIEATNTLKKREEILLMGTPEPQENELNLKEENIALRRSLDASRQAATEREHVLIGLVAQKDAEIIKLKERVETGHIAQVLWQERDQIDILLNDLVFKMAIGGVGIFVAWLFLQNYSSNQHKRA